MRPQPVITSTLFFLNKKAMPWAWPLTIFHLAAELRRVLEIVVYVGVVQEHLGWNAADVQASAA
jgi:hypothetical protein